MNKSHESSQKGTYKSIGGDFYDELAAASLQKQTCEITYLDSQGKEVLLISPVYDIYTDNGVECVRLDQQNIPLDRITSVNGRRSNGEVDTNLLEKGLQPDAAPATEHHKYPDEEARAQADTEISAQPIPADRALQSEDDFVHRFLTSPAPFLMADNEWYSFSADRLQHRLYLKVKKPWATIGEVNELASYIDRIATLIGPECTLLNDLTAIAPDSEGTIWAVPVPNKDALMRHGLIKVADLVPPGCETVVHGMDSFSVNSVRLRYFKDRVAAEHWLTSEREDTNSSQAASA